MLIYRQPRTVYYMALRYTFLTHLFQNAPFYANVLTFRSIEAFIRPLNSLVSAISHSQRYMFLERYF
mgnify:CR=1 FL=1